MSFLNAMDPLVFGSFHNTKLHIFDVPRPPKREVDAADIEEHAFHEEILLNAELNKKSRRQQRRTSASSVASSEPVELPPVDLPPVELPPVELPPVELPPVAPLLDDSPSTEGHASSRDLEPLKLASQPTHMAMSALIAHSRKSGIPHICLFGPCGLGARRMAEWNRFCLHATNVQVIHKTHDSTYILVITRNGKTIVFEDEWLDWILDNEKTRAIYTTAFMDGYTFLSSADQLSNGQSALAYDPLCEMCQNALLTREYDVIIPYHLTQFSSPCVVYRENEMLQTINL